MPLKNKPRGRKKPSWAQPPAWNVVPPSGVSWSPAPAPTPSPSWNNPKTISKSGSKPKRYRPKRKPRRKPKKSEPYVDIVALCTKIDKLCDCVNILANTTSCMTAIDSCNMCAVNQDDDDSDCCWE